MNTLAKSALYSLALDTSGVISLAVFDGEHILKEKTYVGLKYSAADLIVPYIEELLSSVNIKFTELSFITLNVGPGFFTGLRLGITVAKILQLSLKIPAISCGASKVLAYECYLWHKTSNVEAHEPAYIVTLTNVGKDGLVVAILNKDMSYILEDTYFAVEDLKLVANYFKSEGKILVCGQEQDLFADNVLNNDIYIYNRKIKIPNLTYMVKLALIEYNENKDARILKPIYGNGRELNQFS